MDEMKELKNNLHSVKMYIYTTCNQELETIKEQKITEEKVLDDLFERISCLIEDEMFYNLCYRLINYVETFDHYLGSTFRTKVKIYLDHYYEQR